MGFPADVGPWVGSDVLGAVPVVVQGWEIPHYTKKRIEISGECA